LAALRGRGEAVELIDVRTPAEFEAAHAEGARSLPLDSLDPEAFLRARGVAVTGPVYVICQSGVRGRRACERLETAGCPEVVNVEGGTTAWEAAGLPVVRGRKAISLERQVRIAAGSLVVFGVAFGTFVHPAFLGLAAFVGAGLVFAGVTDACGMAMLLARAPWNRRSPSAATATTCAVVEEVAS
jgi:rhodanese-related sulfurtransferase